MKRDNEKKMITTWTKLGDMPNAVEIFGESIDNIRDDICLHLSANIRIHPSRNKTKKTKQMREKSNSYTYFKFYFIAIYNT